jgi:hypothetical protein
MDFGNMFDFSSPADQPMQTVEEQGGWLSSLLPESPWDAYNNAGQMVEDAKKAAGPVVVQTFARKGLTDFFSGDDLLGVDLITYDAPKSGGVLSGLALTPAGKKWALIAGAALVGFMYMRSR